MEKILNKQIDRYLKKVKKYLVMKPQKKKEYITELKSEIETYVEENEITDIKSVISFFGTPEECAKRNFSGVELQYIHKRLKVKKVVTILCIISVLTCFVVLSALFVYAVNEDRGHYMVEYGHETDDEGNPIEPIGDEYTTVSDTAKMILENKE